MGAKRAPPVVVAVAVDDVVERTTREITEQQSLRIGVGRKPIDGIGHRMVADGLETGRNGTDVEQIVGFDDNQFRHEAVGFASRVQEIQLHIAAQNRLQMAQMLGGIIHDESLRLVVIDRHANRRVVKIINDAAQTFESLVLKILALAWFVRGRNPTDEIRWNRRFEHCRNKYRQGPTAIQNILANHRRTAVAVASHLLNRRHIAHSHPKPLAQEIDLRKQVAEGHFLRPQRLRAAQHQRFVHQWVGCRVLWQVQDFGHAVEQIRRRDV